MGSCVAVTGDGINDRTALQVANVGLAMGSGCTAARYASDIILTDNDFEAAIKAVMWGRNIYENITRFLQFQITVNISVLLCVLFGIPFFSESPLSAIQLLWINLIMDSGAALALATEPPLKSILKGKPSTTLLNSVVWRQILGISLWNFFVVLLLFLFGKDIAGLNDFSRYVSATTGSPGSLSDSCKRAMASAGSTRGKTLKCYKKHNKDVLDYKDAQEKLRLFTFIFCTFVFLQLANEINCRKIGQRDFNVFEHFFHNWWFIGVLTIVCLVQYVQIEWFPLLTRTRSMSGSEWGGCIIAGSTSLLVSLCLKMTPSSMLHLIPFSEYVDEDQATTNEFVDFARDGDFDKLTGQNKDAAYEPIQDDGADGYTAL